MRMVKRFFTVLLAVLMIFASLPASSTNTEAASYTINKTSATIEIGSTVQLQMLNGGSVVSGAMWASDNTSVAKVSSSGLVTGLSKGSATITGIYDGYSVTSVISVVKATTSSIKRYTILILDCSSSMKGVPMTRQKTATKGFAKTVLAADGANYVAVISLNSSSRTVLGFTSNLSKVNSAINSLNASGNTNMKAAFESAYTLMKGTPSGSNVIKNIVLCSDGLPTTGTTQTSGKYTKADHSKYYARANSVYAVDVRMKNAGYFVYALGAFYNSSGNNLIFGRRFMKDLASKDKYYEISDPDKFDDIFDDIADDITNVSISNTSMTIYVGESKTITAYKNGVKSSASWTSSNTSVATVSSSGKVTGKKAGTSMVTATVNGTKVTCKVTVKTKVTVTLNKSSIVLMVGEKYVLKATVKGTNGKISWRSGKPNVASIDSNGVVTGMKPGTCYVYAKTGGVSARCKVTVKSTQRPNYACYFKFNTTKFSRTSETINEEGIRIGTNDTGVIEKTAAYIYRSGKYWYVALAFKPYANTVTSAMIYAYVAYNGKTVRDASNSYHLNKYSMYKDSDGIWSMRGKYDTVYFNVTDTKGNIVASASAKKSSVNLKIFTNLDEMKKYLKS